MNHSICRIVQEMQVSLNRIQCGFLVEKSLKDLQHHIDRVNLELCKHKLPIVRNDNKLSTTFVKMDGFFNNTSNS